MSTLNDLRQKRKKVHEDTVPFLEKMKDNSITSEERATYLKMADDIEQMTKDIDTIVAAEKRAKDLEAPVTEPIQGGAPANAEKTAEQIAAENRADWNDWLRNGRPGQRVLGAGKFGAGTLVRGSNPERFQRMEQTTNHLKSLVAKEARDQFAGTQSITYTEGTVGGYFVPAGFVYDVEVATKYYAPLLDGSCVKIFDTATGQVLPYPTSNDTNQAWTIIGEGVQVLEQNTATNYPTQGTAPSGQPGDVGIGQITFGAYKGTTGNIQVSLELLQDSAFNLEAFLTNAFAIRLGRGYEYYLTQGTGVNQPLGIIPALTTSGLGYSLPTPITAAGSSVNDGTTATGANSIGSPDLVNLEHAVDPTYRGNARYMFHDQTLRFLKQQLDKYGRPLWAPGVKDGDPDTINGYRYTINQSFAQISASAITVVFGDFSKFMVRRVRELQVVRLDERYADFGLVAYIGFSRIDSRLLDAGTHPLNYLQQHS
jgi:HK97 family phage major capsid protein